MVDPESLTIREEPFATAWADSEVLRLDHAKEVGPRAGVALNPNMPMFHALAAAGALLVMTVRSNGRCFGYAVSILTPSMENADHLQGYLTAIFVDRHMRGVGPRLVRACVEAMRARGAHEVILRAGVRGSGSKAGALYRRMGAQPMGEMFSIMTGV